MNSAVRACRVCGCTEDNACKNADGQTCSWVDEDLCSACAPDEMSAAWEQAIDDLFDRVSREADEDIRDALGRAIAWGVEGPAFSDGVQFVREVARHFFEQGFSLAAEMAAESLARAEAAGEARLILPGDPAFTGEIPPGFSDGGLPR